MGGPPEKRTLERSRRCKDSIKIDLREVSREDGR
jgi:hypothetical protein